MKLDHADMFHKDCAQAGFSIVELVVVIAILGILMTIGTLNFHQWQVKNNIDRETRELYTDINTARLNAIHTKKRHSVVFNPTSYVLKNYSSEGEDPFAGRIIETKQVHYEMMKKPSTGSSLVALTGEHVVYDVRGFIFNDVGLTVAVTPGDSGAYDCVVLSTGRTNMGKMTNGTCSQ
jgi:prepilin-type N-terminal cleavage/methylation domain-containing protein